MKKLLLSISFLIPFLIFGQGNLTLTNYRVNTDSVYARDHVLKINADTIDCGILNIHKNKTVFTAPSFYDYQLNIKGTDSSAVLLKARNGDTIGSINVYDNSFTGVDLSWGNYYNNGSWEYTDDCNPGCLFGSVPDSTLGIWWGGYGTKGSTVSWTTPTTIFTPDSMATNTVLTINSTSDTLFRLYDGAGGDVAYLTKTGKLFLNNYKFYKLNNVADGELALYSVISGNNNVGIGKKALHDLTLGDGNTSVGTTAGRNLLSGNSNVFIGYQSAYNNNGSWNVIIGQSAGFNCSGASDNNVILGRQAGFNCVSGNVMIGYQSGYNETGSNKLYIENSNSSSPLIYGEFDNDYLKVNGDLHVTDTFRQDSTYTLSDGVTINPGDSIQIYADTAIFGFVNLAIDSAIVETFIKSYEINYTDNDYFTSFDAPGFICILRHTTGFYIKNRKTLKKKIYYEFKFTHL